MGSAMKFALICILGFIIGVLGDPIPQDGGSREGKFLVIANSNQDPSTIPDEGLVVEGEEDLEDLVDTALDEGLPDFDQTPDGELMDTADTLVFRPLFKYKRQNVQKKRVFKDKKPVIQAQESAQPPPQYLVYDKNTGSYYPVSSLNPYYNTRRY